MKKIRILYISLIVLMFVMCLGVLTASAELDEYPVIGSVAYTPVADYPIHAKSFSEVKLVDSFWKPIVDINASVTIPFTVNHPGNMNNNTLQAALYSLQTHPDAALQAKVDARVLELAQGNVPTANSGFEVATLLYQLTGNRVLLDRAVQSASILYDNFIVNKPAFGGGERDAIQCLQLYRTTLDKKHLDLAKQYIDIRGHSTATSHNRDVQTYMPAIEQSEAAGHAVNCVTLMLSLLEVGELSGLKAYTDTAMRMWEDTVGRKMYITGGVGSTGNEGFGDPYVLPNITAYSEACAVFMFITFNQRLFQATGDAKYIDVLERGLYNNTLSSISTSGDRFFYVNRLSSAGDGRDVRWDHASLECCPPNLIRFLATMPGYIYAQNDDGAVYVNLYVSSEAGFKAGGKDLTLTVDSEMPWGGKSKLTVTAPEAVQGAIKLRVPGWAQNQPAPGGLYAYEDTLTKQTTLMVNGQPVSAVPDQSGYLTIDRVWTSGDTVEIEFPIETRRVIADERVREDRGRVAIERGPIVYCAEWPDVAGGKVFDLLLDTLGSTEEDASMGVVLNATARSITNSAAPPQALKLIPYYFWANRGAGEMEVWISTRNFVSGDVGPAGGFIYYDNPNYARDGWRYLEAAPFDQSNGITWGGFRRQIPGAAGRAVGTGKQNTADMVAALPDELNAATICAKTIINGVGGWFLPSAQELSTMYRNLYATGVCDFGKPIGVVDNYSYWSSTQQTADMANNTDFGDNGGGHYDDKDFPRRVRAVRMIDVVIPPGAAEPYNYAVYLAPVKTTLPAGETLLVDVMLVGNINYTQVVADIAYDNSILQFDGYDNLSGWAASCVAAPPNKVALRSLPSSNMLLGAPCTTDVKIVTLKFSVKSGFSWTSATTELSIASAAVSPLGGVVGTTTAPGKAVSVTLLR
jgi:DUF1680 family protein